MRVFKTIMISLFVTPLWAWAGLALPDPSELMAKAQESRVSLREVILDIDMNIPEMRDPATFEKYFFLLDELALLSDKFKMNEYYPNLVKDLGQHMVANGMRWLDITKDPVEKIQYYVKRMDADILGRFLSVLEYELVMVKDVNLLKTAAVNIEVLIPLADERADGQPYLKLGFRRLVTDIAARMLRDNDLSSEDENFWVTKLKLASSMSEYLDSLNQQIYKWNSTNKEAGYLYLGRLLLLSEQMYKLSEATPTYLITAVGDSIVEVLVRAVRLEVGIDLNTFSKALATLSARQIQSLMQQWTTSDKIPSQNFALKYIDYSGALIKKASVFGLQSETEILQKWLGETLAALMGQKNKIEGHYRVYNEKGEVYYFTIVFAKEKTLVASLSDEKGFFYKTFFNISYNINTAEFIASQKIPDSSETPNIAVKFTVTEDGAITILDNYPRRGSSRFKGSKVQDFTHFQPLTNGLAGPIDGTFAGVLYLPSGKTLDVKLIVSSFEGYSVGRLNGDLFTGDFSIGTKSTDGVLTLTTGLAPGASWLQLRGQLTEDGLKTCVIVGGKGQGPSCGILKRLD